MSLMQTSKAPSQFFLFSVFNEIMICDEFSFAMVNFAMVNYHLRWIVVF